MREFVNKYGIVFVVGGEGEKCCEVVEFYGFWDVIILGDIIKVNVVIVFFCVLIEFEIKNFCDFFVRGGKMSDIVVEVVFVFVDSWDWVLDL